MVLMSIARCYLDFKHLSFVLDWLVGLTVKLLIVIVCSMLIVSHPAILSSVILSQLHAFLKAVLLLSSMFLSVVTN